MRALLAKIGEPILAALLVVASMILGLVRALDGSLGLVLLLNTADTSQQADLEAWSTTEFGAPP